MSGRINLDNISDDFKSYLQGLGLTEEQVNEAISLFVGDKELLETNDKSSIVNAINENKTSIQLALEKSEQAFQRGDEVKTKLVDKLISEGLEVSTDNTFEELISGIALGKRVASGKFSEYKNDSDLNHHESRISTDLNFKPSTIIMFTSYWRNPNLGRNYNLTISNNGVQKIICNRNHYGELSIKDIDESGFTVVNDWPTISWPFAYGAGTWFAIE